MDKKILEELKEKLEKEKVRLETELKDFAEKKENGTWEVKAPDFGAEEASFEKEEDQEEEFEKLLDLEKVLEPQLADVEKALERMKKGSYGICEKCGKPIEIERLRANPEARTHVACK